MNPAAERADAPGEGAGIQHLEQHPGFVVIESKASGREVVVGHCDDEQNSFVRSPPAVLGRRHCPHRACAMSAADMLLAKLDAVRSTGRDRWIARCPAHEDRRPSLSIRAAESGVLLVYCWAGCTVHAVAAAVGLDLSDLFPPRAPDVHSRRLRASSLTPLVATFELDLLLVHVLLADLGAGKLIPEADQVSAKAAASRVWDALQRARYVI